MADTTTGKKIIQVLHSELKKRNPQIPESLTEFNELLRRTYFPRDVTEAPAGYQFPNYYPKSSPTSYAIAVDNMGDTLVSFNDIDESVIQEAMEALAVKIGGNIPEKFSSIQMAFTTPLTEVKFFPMAAFVLAESGKQIASGVEKAGETILSVGEGIYKIKEYIVPIAIGVGALALLVFIKVKAARS